MTSATAQVETEIAPPFNIKTVSFIQNNQNVVPIFTLGSGFQLQFDDLYGNEADYYYEIIHCDYNWKPSEIPKNEYLQGFDNQRIQNYTNLGLRGGSACRGKINVVKWLTPGGNRINVRITSGD